MSLGLDLASRSLTQSLFGVLHYFLINQAALVSQMCMSRLDRRKTWRFCLQVYTSSCSRLQSVLPPDYPILTVPDYQDHAFLRIAIFKVILSPGINYFLHHRQTRWSKKQSNFGKLLEPLSTFLGIPPSSGHLYFNSRLHSPTQGLPFPQWSPRESSITVQ